MRIHSFAVAVAALLILSPAAGAFAAPPQPGTTILQEGLVAPLHLSIGPGRVVTVSTGSSLTNISRGAATPIYDAPEWDVTGTAHQGTTAYFVESQGAGPDRTLVGSLKAIDDRGRMTTIADLPGAQKNPISPDKAVRYGLSPDDAVAHPGCVTQLQAVGFRANNQGENDAHTYAVAVGDNTAYVADAGTNAVLSVDLTTGAIKVVAVLPPRPSTITDAMADDLSIPECVGLTYNFEAVPTDVEVGPDGLYVSSLPRGPHDASLDDRGVVFRIDPISGETQTQVEGIVSPTGIALDGEGNLYIASLFGRGVLRVPAGTHTASLFIEANQTADVEVSGSTLYATTEVFGNGTVIAAVL